MTETLAISELILQIIRLVIIAFFVAVILTAIVMIPWFIKKYKNDELDLTQWDPNKDQNAQINQTNQPNQNNRYAQNNYNNQYNPNMYNSQNSYNVYSEQNMHNNNKK